MSLGKTSSSQNGDGLCLSRDIRWDMRHLICRWHTNVPPLFPLIFTWDKICPSIFTWMARQKERHEQFSNSDCHSRYSRCWFPTIRYVTIILKDRHEVLIVWEIIDACSLLLCIAKPTQSGKKKFVSSITTFYIFEG